MKIIIAGAGDVGFHLAELLAFENQDIILIDQDQEVLDYAASHLDVLVLRGDCGAIHILEQAGAKGADLVLAVTTSEKTNLITTI
ncbi:MAG: NAD-binding protein [Bacteroidota bacterium]